MSVKRTCPGCGEEFPKGGAYTTHVRNCDLTDTDPGEKPTDEQTDQERIEELESQVDALQKLVFTIAEQQGKRLDYHENRIQSVEDQLLDVGNEMILPLAEKIDEHSQMWSTLGDWIEQQMLNEAEEIAGREFTDLEQALEYAEQRKKIQTVREALEDEQAEARDETIVDNVADVIDEKPVRTAVVEGDRPVLDAILGDNQADTNSK